MSPLTERQQDLLNYLRSCDRCPSFTEMKDALGLTSKSGIHRLVLALEERGYVTRLPNRSRAIQLRGPIGDLSKIPLETLTAEVDRRVQELMRYLYEGGRA